MDLRHTPTLFDKFGFYPGHPVITCADAAPKTVPKLKIWSEVKSCVIDKTHLIKLIKVSVWILSIPDDDIRKGFKLIICYSINLNA